MTLLRYTDGESRRWHTWLAARPPTVLDEPMGEGRLATLRGVLVHIFAVEMRHTQRLLGEPVSAYDTLPQNTLDEIFRIGVDARRKLSGFLDTDPDLDRELTFETLTAGTHSASVRKVVAHSIIHGIRHWAQIATVLRQRGYPAQWFHDILLSDAL